MNLLIVDDDEEVSSFVRYVLEEERFNVRVAGSVGEARAHLSDFRPDLVILDRGLPDADGLDFCRELRAAPATAALPVLFLSAARSPADVADGLNGGADDYVTKPFAFVELVARVQALLRRPERAARA